MKATTKKQDYRTVLKINDRLSLEEQIEQRAHELWDKRGRVHGNDMNDWFQAEREINEWHEAWFKNRGHLQPK